MCKTSYQLNRWHYLTGDFLNRVHIPLKNLSVLTQKNINLFSY